MSQSVVRIGTSGYSYKDWKGIFYPEKIDQSKMLDFYAEHFDTVEINSTYYGIPRPQVFENMAKKTKPDFEFIIKAHQSMTHKRELLHKETPVFLEAIKPMAESGKLTGILAQFPWSFPNTPENLNYLCKCRELLADYPLFVEFRHSSWIKEEIFQLLRAHQIGYVSVDEPQLEKMVPPFAVATADIGYVRFHGRNSSSWYSGGSERYNYMYSREELLEWSRKIRSLQKGTKKVYAFFNTSHLGCAIFNAKQFVEIMNALQN
jgi:uncharacterized protein YecE (DUF72 family)